MASKTVTITAANGSRSVVTCASEAEAARYVTAAREKGGSARVQPAGTTSATAKLRWGK
jgi:hypothetical protein